MAGWHHQLNGHRFGSTLGVGDGQGCMACCGSCENSEVLLSSLSVKTVTVLVHARVCVTVSKTGGWKEGRNKKMCISVKFLVIQLV